MEAFLFLGSDEDDTAQGFKDHKTESKVVNPFQIIRAQDLDEPDRVGPAEWLEFGVARRSDSLSLAHAVKPGTGTRRNENLYFTQKFGP